MTEVPEHLLDRSRQRRAALGLGGDGGDAPAGDDAPAPAKAESAAAPAVPAAAAPAVPEPTPEPPAPVPPYVEAAERRRKVPMWALPVVAFLPLWGLLYVETLSPPSSGEPNQLELGAELYTSQGCAGCHGAGGGGGTGRPLADGEVLATFPTIEGMIEFVWLGTAAFQGEVYGNPDREGGPHVGGTYQGGAVMPAYLGQLDDEQILAVVRHERETISGEAIDPMLIGPDGELLHSNGEPYINDEGRLVDADGNLMFDDDGLLIAPTVPAELAAG